MLNLFTIRVSSLKGKICCLEFPLSSKHSACRTAGCRLRLFAPWNRPYGKPLNETFSEPSLFESTKCASYADFGLSLVRIRAASRVAVLVTFSTKSNPARRALNLKINEIYQQTLACKSIKRLIVECIHSTLVIS